MKSDAKHNAISMALTNRTLLIGVLLLATGVRAYQLGVEDFWQDEIHSMYNSACARGSAERVPHGLILRNLPRYSDLTERSTPANVWKTMDDDSHPPLYFLLLLAWRRVVGDGEAWIRLMPAAFSVLSIVPAWFLMRELGAKAAAPIVGLILALSFCHINMAQENRPYSLSTLLVNVSFYLLVKQENRWSTWTRPQRLFHGGAHAATLFLAMMNHYFAGFAFCGQLVYVLIRWRGPLLRAWVLSTGAAAVVFCLLWGPHIWRQREFIASQDWLLEKEADHAQRTVLRVADLPVRVLFRVSRFRLSDRNALLGAAMFVAGALWLRARRSRNALLFACWYFVPVLMFAATDVAAQRQHLTHFRYTSVVIPGLAALIALAFCELPRAIGFAGVAAFAFACVPTLRTLPAQDNPHTRSAVSLITSDLRPTDLVIFDAVEWPSFWALRMYQMFSYHLPFPSPTMLLLREPPNEATLSEIRGFDHLYVVTPNPEGIPNPTPETHPFVEKSEYFKEIGWVYRCSRGKDGA